jgi:DNA-binding CsgD family transcriptional regulator
MGLGRTDFEAILDFLARVDTIDSDEPYAREVLLALKGLVPCDSLGYQEADLDARCFMDTTPETAEEDALYWAVGPCPIMDYRSRTGDTTAVRMSDIVARARYRELPVYREYFEPAGMDHVLDLGLSPARQDYRSVVLLRGEDVSDFSERDRAVLETLRPHLRARESRAALVKLAAGGAATVQGTASRKESPLTIREREIVAMVGTGKTNAQIAAELWVTPATVKKHLENVYLKLGVGSRAAAASRVQAGSREVAT